MADCYITSTGSYLPGEPVENKDMNQYLGKVLGEGRVQSKILLSMASRAGIMPWTKNRTPHTRYMSWQRRR